MLVRLKDFIFRIIYILLIIYLLIFVPSVFGHKPLVIISGSMEPVLKIGGILYYEKININKFDEGDILVYTTKDHIISHRIINITDNGFVTKGDTNNTVDGELVNPKQVLGKGTDWSIPFIGYYADYVNSHKYLLYISLGVIILDFCNDTYKLHKTKVGKKIEKE